jgi:hypothetical protein
VFAREALISHGRISAPVRTPKPAGPSPRAIECRRTSASKARTSRHMWAFDSGYRRRRDKGHRALAKVTPRAGSFLCNSSSIAARILRSRDGRRMPFLHPSMPARQRLGADIHQVIRVGETATRCAARPSRADGASKVATSPSIAWEALSNTKHCQDDPPPLHVHASCDSSEPGLDDRQRGLEQLRVRRGLRVSAESGRTGRSPAVSPAGSARHASHRAERRRPSAKRSEEAGRRSRP